MIKSISVEFGSQFATAHIKMVDSTEAKCVCLFDEIGMRVIVDTDEAICEAGIEDVVRSVVGTVINHGLE